MPDSEVATFVLAAPLWETQTCTEEVFLEFQERVVVQVLFPEGILQGFGDALMLPEGGSVTLTVAVGLGVSVSVPPALVTVSV